MRVSLRDDEDLRGKNIPLPNRTVYSRRPETDDANDFWRWKVPVNAVSNGPNLIGLTSPLTTMGSAGWSTTVVSVPEENKSGDHASYTQCQLLVNRLSSEALSEVQPTCVVIENVIIITAHLNREWHFRTLGR